ncbi:MAG: glycosyltransferase family 39 protein [Gemmatimonadota bacterium]|nr:glycosyltransferase family 39 protein [Gemmatimonadota bacterium]
MTEEGNRLNVRAFLFLLTTLCVGLVMRLWGDSFGLPHIFHSDEAFEVHRALRLAKGGFDIERWAKGGLYMLLCVEYGVYFLVQRVQGAVNSVDAFAMEFAKDPTVFWKIGRVTVAFLGTWTIWKVWRHGRRLAGVGAGLYAAWFLAFSFRHVVESHTVTVDVPMALFTFWAVAMIVEEACGVRRLRGWAFALVAGIALLHKVPAIVLFVPYFVNSMIRGGVARGGRDEERGLFTKATWLPFFGACGLYVGLNPGVVLGFSEALGFFGGTNSGAPGDPGDASEMVRGVSLWGFYFRSLLHSQGPVGLSLALMGVVFGLRRRAGAMLLHLSFLLPFFVLITATSSPHLYYDRYIVPMLPGLCLLAGLGLDGLLRALRLDRAVMAPVGMLVALMLVLGPAAESVRFNQKMTRTDTRTLAAEWMEANVANGTTVLLEGFPEDPSQQSIPLRPDEDGILEMVMRLELTDAGKAELWRLRMHAWETRICYDLLAVRDFELWDTLEKYRLLGAEYAVIRREAFTPGNWRRGRFREEIVAKRLAFREEMVADPECRLVAAFDPADDDSPGYHIEIWRLGASASTGSEAD